MRLRAVTLMACAASLAGCDAATQIAGDAMQGEVRSAVAAQCRQVAESAGIVAARVAEVCECSAETFVADEDLNLADVSRARIEGIVNACAKQTSTGPGRAAATEGTGG